MRQRVGKRFAPLFAFDKVAEALARRSAAFLVPDEPDYGGADADALDQDPAESSVLRPAAQPPVAFGSNSAAAAPKSSTRRTMTTLHIKEMSKALSPGIFEKIIACSPELLKPAFLSLKTLRFQFGDLKSVDDVRAEAVKIHRQCTS